jgi:hypothetical protein
VQVPVDVVVPGDGGLRPVARQQVVDPVDHGGGPALAGVVEHRPQLAAQADERGQVLGVGATGHPRPGGEEAAQAVERAQWIGGLELVGLGGDQVDGEGGVDSKSTCTPYVPVPSCEE